VGGWAQTVVIIAVYAVFVGLSSLPIKRRLDRIDAALDRIEMSLDRFDATDSR
jgi:hypothetical protein